MFKEYGYFVETKDEGTPESIFLVYLRLVIMENDRRDLRCAHGRG